MTGSSSTSSRTSASSSTSEPPARTWARLLGWLRLTHPFPSVLDGLVVAGVAVVAGGDPAATVRAGVSMTLLQLGIGTVNDIVDAPFDAGRKPGKPIPAGLVPAGAARIAAVALFVAAVVLAASLSLAVAGLALVSIGIGLAYDLRLKGTAWSWLPFAIGIPILPVYGWVAATGRLEPVFLVLVPTAATAGAALAIANSLVDVERDVAAGRTSVAARLGYRPAARLATALLLGVTGAGGSFLLATSAPAAPGLVTVFAAGVATVAAAVSVERPSLAERTWQVEAVALGVAAIAWLVAVLG